MIPAHRSQAMSPTRVHRDGKISAGRYLAFWGSTVGRDAVDHLSLVEEGESVTTSDSSLGEQGGGSEMRISGGLNRVRPTKLSSTTLQ